MWSKNAVIEGNDIFNGVSSSDHGHGPRLFEKKKKKKNIEASPLMKGLAPLKWRR
jgi:hypothetical protein